MSKFSFVLSTNMAAIQTTYWLSLRIVCARNIAPKSTFRLAYKYGRLSPLNNATSSLFGKPPYLACELLVNNGVQRLQAGQQHHLTILLVLNGGEVTNSLLMINNRNVHLETLVSPSTIYDHKQSPFEG